MILYAIQSVFLESSLDPVENVKDMMLFWSVKKDSAFLDFLTGRTTLTARAEIEEQG